MVSDILLEFQQREYDRKIIVEENRTELLTILDRYDELNERLNKCVYDDDSNDNVLELDKKIEHLHYAFDKIAKGYLDINTARQFISQLNKKSN